ncbi:MAG TPA: hypothetical protein VEQ11_07670 [Chloroflexota bacterium]|nr:hypothetical protein [Chloroflexota bacterium]
MGRKPPSSVRTFLTAVLYGVALLAGLTNSLVFASGLSSGHADPSNLSLGLLGWGLVLYIHRQRGWPPFRRS